MASIEYASTLDSFHLFTTPWVSNAQFTTQCITHSTTCYFFLLFLLTSYSFFLLLLFLFSISYVQGLLIQIMKRLYRHFRYTEQPQHVRLTEPFSPSSFYLFSSFLFFFLFSSFSFFVIVPSFLLVPLYCDLVLTSVDKVNVFSLTTSTFFMCLTDHNKTQATQQKKSFFYFYFFFSFLLSL